MRWVQLPESETTGLRHRDTQLFGGFATSERVHTTISDRCSRADVTATGIFRGRNGEPIDLLFLLAWSRPLRRA
jgi:hypothetical protein